ncbi:MAG: hypothetical protein ACFE95_01860, partial [Candidatus Hodarchaeota archaeon]
EAPIIATERGSKRYFIGGITLVPTKDPSNYICCDRSLHDNARVSIKCPMLKTERTSLLSSLINFKAY